MLSVLEEYMVNDQEDREIGIEIEVEGSNLPIAFERVWRTVPDGSLRGNSAEYVLKKPCKRNQVTTRLKFLQDTFKKNGTKVVLSDRTGVHIHINCQKLNFVQTMNFVLLYLMIEGLLVKWCGEEREGNLFCLSATDAEYLIVGLRRAMSYGSFRKMQGNTYRYSSVNVASLSKFGSIEFRAFKTPKKMKEIQTWIDLLLRVFDASKQFVQTRDIVDNLSMRGPEYFLQDILGDMAELVDCPDMNSILIDGARLIQEVAFEPIQINKTKARKKRKLPFTYVQEDILDAPRIELQEAVERVQENTRIWRSTSIFVQNEN